MRMVLTWHYIKWGWDIRFGYSVNIGSAFFLLSKGERTLNVKGDVISDSAGFRRGMIFVRGAERFFSRAGDL